MARELKKPKYQIVGETARFNEIDNVQGRVALEPGSALWKEYYSQHPELEKLGSTLVELRKKRNLASPQDAMLAGSMFGTIDLIAHDESLGGQPSPHRITMDPKRASEKIKGFCRQLGADLVKIGPLNQAWVYSHVGRASYPEKEIGAPISLPHQHAIVVAMALDRRMVRCAPVLPVEVDVASKYVMLAVLASALARYIRMLGYSARANNVRNYQLIVPPIAIDAGVGELGRNGVVISEEHGSAMKMNVVTTDMPLARDNPVDIGVDEFCHQCRICADYCPVNAIPRGDKTVTRGVRKWKINDAACYSYWRKCGTDCGICIAVCPWNRPRHFPHNAILRGVQSSALFRELAIRADIIFGNRERYDPPDWLEQQPDIWKEALRRDHPWRGRGR
jgi:reductive dehalogenase